MSEVRRVSEIVFREDLYPRIQANHQAIQRYAQNVEKLDPIEINQHDELIDGYHRLTAHRTAEADTITVTVTPTSSDLEFLALAIQRNSKHGIQLAEEDKKKMAIRLYAAGTGMSKEEIAEILSVTVRSVTTYLTDIDKQMREERKQRIFDMWMACYTQDEIADAVNIDRSVVSSEIKTFVENGSASKFHKSLTFDRDSDFNPPLYNIWSFAKKTNAVTHFGNSEQRIVDNLLYLYTEPFDIVLDPFAGGGSTIDVCKRRLRRCYSSDRKPIPARENEIRKLDIAAELPALNRNWSEVTLTYLDPPYWKQAEGQYSKDAEDLANMPLEQFTSTLAGIIKSIAAKQSKGVITLLIQPTQWKAPERETVDHVLDLIGAVGNKRLTLESRISCPYPTEQYTPQMVEWAKEHKKLLVLTRELIIWRVNQ